MKPYSTGGVWVNALMDADGERIRAAYGDNYDRLVQVKNEWDSENLFRTTHDVEPTDD
jgi:hypothetical protein